MAAAAAAATVAAKKLAAVTKAASSKPSSKDDVEPQLANPLDQATSCEEKDSKVVVKEAAMAPSAAAEEASVAEK